MVGQSVLINLIVASISLAQSGTTQTTSAAAPAMGNPFVRHYQEGEKKINYTMTCTNQNNSYEIQAKGIVSKDANGNFAEDFAWSRYMRNGKHHDLVPAESGFRQHLSLSPGAFPAMPDLSQTPQLVGPITDLMTFYVDWQLAAMQPNLVKAGDHAHFHLPFSPSWADGSHIIVGEDSIDFELTLMDIDVKNQVAELLVRHVPPAAPTIKIPVDWMKAPVADTPNNWVEVQKNDDGTFSARIGKETFDVEMKVDLDSGKIVSGSIDNVVEVLERKCEDAALTQAGEAKRYQIKRRIEIR
jgi:hypothetical protein